jgi:hypothetical protein
MKRSAALFPIALALGAITRAPWASTQAQDSQEEGPIPVIAMAGRHTKSRNLREPVLNLFSTRANRALAPFGLRVSRIRHDWGDVSTYIPFAEAIADAARTKLSVGDYRRQTGHCRGNASHNR